MKFLKELQLIGLGLKSSSTSINRKAFFDLMAEERKPVRKLSEVYGPTSIGEDFFEVEGRYDVAITDGKDVGLKLQCVFELHMHAPSPVDSALVERFAQSDLRFILLPYARQFISGVTSQMEIPPIVLPLATAAGKARVARASKEE